MRAQSSVFKVIIAIILLGVIAIVAINFIVKGGSKANLAFECKTQGGSCMSSDDCYAQGGSGAKALCENPLQVCCVT